MDKKLMNDNKGFSLVELIVTVLITAILMIAVVAFISSSRTMYQTVNTSATLQEEAITAERVFTEAFMEAKTYQFQTGVDLSSGIDTDVIWTQSRENSPASGDTNPDDSIYCFVIDKTNHEIRYYKDVHNETGMVLGGSLTTEGKNKLADKCFGTNAKYCVISKNVKSVSLTKIPRADGTDLVCMEIVFEYVGKEYTENITVVTRNLTHAPTITAAPTATTAPDPTAGP